MSVQNTREFPLLLSYEDRRALGQFLMTFEGRQALGGGAWLVVPWDMLTPHEEQAKRNHGGQTFEVLASRGGLGPDEVLAVLDNRKWRSMPITEAMAELKTRTDAWRAKQGGAP